VDLQDKLQATLGDSYRFERELTGAGMSRVFVAAETSLGRRVVVKVLSHDLTASISTERFRKEIQLAASLQHPHIVSVLAAGQAEGVLYYTMPLIEGPTLRARLSQSGEFPIAEAVNVLRDVTRALAYAHRRGVAHRDIKPENVILAEDGAMVVDFGVAKALSASTGGSDSGIITGVGVALGTPAYMSPEQAAADPMTDHRSDIYSLGIVAYEMLAGFSPFAGRPMSAILSAVATETPPPIERKRQGISHQLASLITRSLAKRPADRPQTAEIVLRELDAIAAELGAKAHPVALSRNPWSYAALAAGLVLASAVAVWAVNSLRPAGAGTPAQVRALAVLPFANISDTKSDESFSDGMTEELVAALGKIDGLRVKSASTFKGSQVDVRDLGKQLGVQSVVAASVRRSGDHVRISARLVNVADGFQQWSESYERVVRDANDVFAIQDDIARAIVGALKLKLSLTPAGQSGRRSTNLEAYNALLNGRYYMAKRTPDALRSAIKFFEEAVRRDSLYALAWVGLADANALLYTYAFVNPSEVFGRARYAVGRALQLDSSLAEAWATQGYIQLNNGWDWKAAERAFERSVQLDSNYATAHHWFSLYYDAMGRFDDAQREIKRALELDPVSLIINREYGRTFYYRGDYDRAFAASRRALELDPTFRSAHVWLARAYIGLGKYNEAIDELRDQPDFQGGHSSAVLAYAYVKSGRPDQARAILEELKARSKRENVWPMHMATIQLALGHREEALSLLEQEYEHRAAQIAYVRVDPLYLELHGNRRFGALVRKMNLASPTGR